MVNFKNIGVLLASLAAFVTAAPTVRAADETPDVTDKYIVTLKSGFSECDVSQNLSWIESVHKRSLSHRDLAGVENVYNISDFHSYSSTFG